MELTVLGASIEPLPTSREGPHLLISLASFRLQHSPQCYGWLLSFRIFWSELRVLFNGHQTFPPTVPYFLSQGAALRFPRHQPSPSIRIISFHNPAYGRFQMIQFSPPDPCELESPSPPSVPRNLSTSSVSFCCASSRGLCMSALPSVHSTEYTSILTPTRLCSVEGTSQL